jgi:hypothetical protein
MATYKPIRKTESGTEEIKIPYAVLANPPTIPTATSDLTNDSGFITSDGTVKSVVDYGNTNKNIKIGYSGAGITGGNIKYIAGYTVGDGTTDNIARIKDVSKDALKSWLGYATVATTGSYTDLSNTPTILSEADVKGIKVNNAANADVAGEARKISYNMIFHGYKHLGNGAMSETTMMYNGSDIRKLFFGDEFQFLNADSTTTDDPNKSHRLTLKPTGVAAGTYNSVTVDAKGRVIAGTNTPAVDTSNLAKLDAENTFTKGQVITGGTSDGYSVKASGYVKGSWLQSSVMNNKGANTGMVCVFDGNGWIYYRTPSEILSEASGVPKSAFSLTGTTLTITI